MIKPGDAVPSTSIRLVTSEETFEVDAAEYLGQGKTVLITLPGAFTPTCHANHLPGYVALASKLSEAGVDRIVCATVNDHHVVRAWGNYLNALHKIVFFADSDASFATMLGLDRDLTATGLGIRYFRSAMIIDNGMVSMLFVDEKPGQVTTTGAPAILQNLRS